MKDNDDNQQQASGVSAQTINAANALPNYMPPWMKNIQPMQLPQGGPGQLQMLAQDLARGGYGTGGNFQDKVKSNFNWMDMFYNPVNTFKIDPNKKPDTKPTTTGTPAPKVDPGGMWVNKPGGGEEFKQWFQLASDTKKKMGY